MSNEKLQWYTLLTVLYSVHRPPLYWISSIVLHILYSTTQTLATDIKDGIGHFRVLLEYNVRF